LFGFCTTLSIIPLPKYTSEFKEKLPNDPCIVLIGALISSTPTLLIELFDCNYAPTGIFIDQVNPQDVVVNKWRIVENLTKEQKKMRKNDERNYKNQIKMEKDRIRGEQVEKERIEMQIKEKERLEQERIKKEVMDKERLEQEIIEKERLEKEKIEREKREKEERDRLRKESKRIVNERYKKERQMQIENNNTKEANVDWELFEKDIDLDILSEEI